VANGIEIDNTGVEPEIKMERPTVEGINEPMQEFHYHLIRATQDPKHDLELAEALRILKAHHEGTSVYPNTWEIANKDKKMQCWHDKECAEVRPPEHPGHGR
jgi:hypothetical protein